MLLREVGTQLLGVFSLDKKLHSQQLSRKIRFYLGKQVTLAPFYIHELLLMHMLLHVRMKRSQYGSSGPYSTHQNQRNADSSNLCIVIDGSSVLCIMTIRTLKSFGHLYSMNEVKKRKEEKELLFDTHCTLFFVSEYSRT